MHGTYFIQDLAVILLVAGVVGWICQKIGLSVVVGFLAAGILVGPASPVMALISDTSDIEILARIGLIFLMFAIGLKLSLRKLRRLGPALLGATTIGALGMYAFSRLFAASLGWTWQEGLFLAGMLMVSSRRSFPRSSTRPAPTTSGRDNWRWGSRSWRTSWRSSC